MDNGLAQTEPSKVHLRMVERLRSGLPPSESIEELCVEFDRPLAAMHRLLRCPEGGRRWLSVRGQYGSGKTHCLQVLRSQALRCGYATCYLCADGHASALNHPERFLRGLLGTMEVPDRPGAGYEQLITEILATVTGRDWLLDAVTRWSIGSRQPFGTAVTLLGMLDYATPGQLPDPYIQAQIADHLSGETMVYRGATPSAREVIYHLILLACEVVRHAGCAGFAIMIDEVESVFTKMPSARSRSGAMRVLAALCEADQMEHVIAALAITPDADRQLREESDVYDRFSCHPLFEPLDSFLASYQDERHIVDCGVPSPRARRMLLDRIRAAYGRAYPSASGVDFAVGGEWDRLAAESLNGLPIRLLVRGAVDLMDLARFRSRNG